MPEVLTNQPFEKNYDPQHVINNIEEFKLAELEKLAKEFPNAGEEKQDAIMRSINNAIIELRDTQGAGLTEEQNETVENLLEKIENIKNKILI
jgi:hypothetical protein